MLPNNEELYTIIQDLQKQVAELQAPKPPVYGEKYTDIEDITGMFRTIDNATELTNATATQANSMFEQIFIDTSTGTKKLYIYDYQGKVWRSCTIT